MGRARRKPDSRQFPRGPVRGAPPGFRLLRESASRSVTENYKKLPQGPPLLEDGEENPEAQEIASMALGQCGRDAQGRGFQLLDWQGSISILSNGQRIPEFLLMRSFDDEKVFLLPGKKRETLLRESVGYPVLSKDQLAQYADLEGRSSSWRAGLWLMREQGYWDLQVATESGTYTQISMWVLEEEGNQKRMTEHEVTPRARAAVERVAEDVETVEIISYWQDRYKDGLQPRPQDQTDQLRREGRLFLLGEPNGFLDMLGSQKLSQDGEVMAQVIRESISRLPDPLPERGSKEFRAQIAPLWRAVSRLEVL